MCLDVLRQTFSEISLVTLRWDYTTMYETRRRIQTLESTKKFSKLQVRIELTTLWVLGSEFKRKFTRILGLHLGLAQNSAVFYIYLKSPYSTLSFVLLLDGSPYFIFFKSYNLACNFFSLLAVLLSMFCSVFSWNLSTLQALFCVTLWQY